MSLIPPIVILFLVVTSHIKLRFLELVTTSLGLACQNYQEKDCDKDQKENQNNARLHGQRQEVLLLFAGPRAVSTAQGDEEAGCYCEFISVSVSISVSISVSVSVSISVCEMPVCLVSCCGLSISVRYLVGSETDLSGIVPSV